MILGRKVYYLTSFVAGGVLLACELLVARLIGPFFGASLYVWAATIGTTLAGLAIGYSYAGQLSEKSDLPKILFKVTLVTAAYLLILPFLSSAILGALIPLEVIVGILISTALFNLPLFFLMGLFSPIIIQLLSNSNDEAGNYAGRVYGISTASGVLFLVVVGIYLLPSIGSVYSVYFCSGLMFMVSGVQFISLKKSEK